MVGDDPSGEPDPAVLDALRRSLDVRIRRDGTITMGGGAVTHPRVRTAVLRGLDRTDGGALCFRFGGRWAYVTAEDHPLRVRHAAPCGDTLRVDLDDGRHLDRPIDALRYDEHGLVLQVPSIPSGRPLLARLTNRAAAALADRLSLGPRGPTIATTRGPLPIPKAPQDAVAPLEPQGPR